MMDRLTICWEWVRETLHDRPIQVILTAIAAVLAAVSLTAAIYQSKENKDDIDHILSVFCNGQSTQTSPEQIKNCQKLFDKLLLHPTPEQAKRIKEIIKNGE